MMTNESQAWHALKLRDTYFVPSNTKLRYLTQLEILTTREG